MEREVFRSFLLFTGLEEEDRRIMHDLMVLLSETDGRYRDHLETSVRLLQDVAEAEGFCTRWRPADRGQVVPLRRVF